MKIFKLLPLLVLAACYNPELPSEADQYFEPVSWNQGKMVKTFMVEIALSNREEALSYLGSHAGITNGQKPTEEEFDAFAATLIEDLKLFKDSFSGKTIELYGSGGSSIESYTPYRWGAYTLVGVVIPLGQSQKALYELNLWCYGPGLYQKRGGEYDHYWAKAKEQCKILDFKKVKHLNILLNYHH